MRSSTARPRPYARRAGWTTQVGKAMALAFAVTLGLAGCSSGDSTDRPTRGPSIDATFAPAPAPAVCPTHKQPISDKAILGIAAGGDLPSLKDPAIKAALKRWGQPRCPVIRLDAQWRQIEPTGPGEQHWEAIDKVLLAIVQYNATQSPDRRFFVVLPAAYAPTWAASPGLNCNDVLCAPSAAHVADYGRFVGKVNQHLIDLGLAFILEIWTEQNIGMRFMPRVDPQLYAQMLIAAHNATGGAPALFGGLGPADNAGGNARPITFLQEVTAALTGKKNVFSGVAVHPYDGWAPTEEMHAYVQAHYGDLPFFATEIGAKAPNQAATLSGLISQGLERPWVRMILVYSPPSDDQGFGLWDAHGDPKDELLDAYRKQLAATGQMPS